VITEDNVEIRVDGVMWVRPGSDEESIKRTFYSIDKGEGQGGEGLVHISEIPDEMTADSSPAPDSPIKVRVLQVDDGRRRISLSLRQASPLAKEGTQ